MLAIWQGWQTCEHGLAGGKVEARGQCPRSESKGNDDGFPAIDA